MTTLPGPCRPGLRRWRAALCAGLWLAAALPSFAQAPDCLQSLLASLGWQFTEDDGATMQVAGGQPCTRASRAEAVAAGDLRATLPRDPVARERGLQALLAHPATACAFAYDMGDATRRAVDRLAANDGYRFTALQTGWIGFGWGGAARDGWTPLFSLKRGLQPAGAPSKAITAFYTGTVRSECGVGRQVAQYAAQAELYGLPGFDAEFAPAEIVIGTFNKLRRTPSILLGSGAGEFAPDGLARKAAALGRQAFMGQPGFVVHAFHKRFLDDINNQAQNFVVYDVDAAAAASLRERGGFAHFNAVNRELWQLSRTVRKAGFRRAYERLLADEDPDAWARLDAADTAVLRRMQALLADPYYGGFRIYVHDRGVKPLRYHVARMLDRNPRTPYRVELSLSNVYTTLMQRWFAHRLRTCPAEPDPA